MSDRKYVLNYWNIPGRGESIRVLLTLGGMNFENNFVPLPMPFGNPEGVSPPPFDEGMWPALKPNTPWGTLPTLTLPSGAVIGQQRSILRYLGKKIIHKGAALYPNDPEAAAIVDGFMDMLEDIWPVLVGVNGPAVLETAPIYSTLMGQGWLDDFLNPRMEPGAGDIAFQFDCLEKAMSHEGPFLLGSDLSCADILLFAAIPWWGAGVFRNMDKMLENRPKVERCVRAIGQIEVIANYYASLRASRESLPVVGSTNYTEYYKNFHGLCGVN